MNSNADSNQEKDFEIIQMDELTFLDLNKYYLDILTNYQIKHFLLIKHYSLVKLTLNENHPNI